MKRSHKEKNFFWQVSSFAVGDLQNSKAQYIVFLKYTDRANFFFFFERDVEGKENKRKERKKKIEMSRCDVRRSRRKIK